MGYFKSMDIEVNQRLLNLAEAKIARLEATELWYRDNNKPVPESLRIVLQKARKSYRSLCHDC